jgi:glycosyltransferase involved in cell wall biosynthesis
MNRRVLIIGYFLVDQNMGGVRLRRIARLLPRHGWEPVVLTHPPDENSPVTPPEVRSEHVAAVDLTRLYSRLRGFGRAVPAAAPGGARQPAAKPMGFTSALNRWLMVPDKQMTWHGRALERGRKLLREEKFDAIYASLDPRTNVLVAARLSRESGIPCVLEYRDLWTGNPYHHIAQPTPVHRWLHERLERRALRQASRVTAVCRGIADRLVEQHGDVLRTKPALNYNFFDPFEYAEPVAVPSKDCLTISYTGALYASRTPHQFFEGMRLFIDRQRLSPAQFRFRWAGAIAGVSDLDGVIDRTGVRPYMEFMGQIPHAAAMRLMRESHAALLIQAPNDAIHIPGKLFEAMGGRVPLLALAHPCEVTEIIDRCRAGLVCPHTKESVADALEEFQRRSRQGLAWEFDEAQVNQFSADASVARLAGLFREASA